MPTSTLSIIHYVHSARQAERRKKEGKKKKEKQDKVVSSIQPSLTSMGLEMRRTAKQWFS